MKPLLAALNGINTPYLPVWFFRQAGRYLPEYQELKSKHSFLELLSTPELASEVTLQPIRRFNLDGAIIFSDILTPLGKLGIEVDYEQGSGPKLILPAATLEEIANGSYEAKKDYCQATADAISVTKEKLQGTATTLLGFCGAPFTLFSYLVQASSESKSVKHSPLDPFAEVKEALYKGEWVETLLSRIESSMVAYLKQQVEAGAEALVIFESWGMVASPELYNKFFLPRLKKFLADLEREVSVPVCFYLTNTLSHIETLKELNLKSAAVDWRAPLQRVSRELPGVVLQGNLDPALLTFKNLALKESIDSILTVYKERGGGNVFNVGHGLLPTTKINLLKETVDYVRSHF